MTELFGIMSNKQQFAISAFYRTENNNTLLVRINWDGETSHLKGYQILDSFSKIEFDFFFFLSLYNNTEYWLTEHCHIDTLLGPALMNSEGLSVINNVYLGLHTVKAVRERVSISPIISYGFIICLKNVVFSSTDTRNVNVTETLTKVP